ncbi:MAG: rod shape-determining protein RodA [Sphingobacteriales bacterium]|nr:MAG: rod shape-determining protein RodA [Sphingobacteriales bacterium]
MPNNSKNVFQRVDGLTVFLYLLLVAIGILAVFSVEYRSTDASIFIMSKSHMKQTMWLGISLFVGLIILLTDSKFFSNIAFLSYTGGILLLIITIFAGKATKGSHSWLEIGPIAFQPGEVCKIFTSLALARFFALSEVNFKTLKDRLIAAGFALLPCLLIILQNETGLALVYFSFFLVMFREGLPSGILIAAFSMVALTLATLLLSHTTLLIIIGVGAILLGYLYRTELLRNHLAKLIFIGSLVVAVGYSQFAVPLVFKNVLKGYQKERIYSMLGVEVPEEYRDATEDPDAPKKDTDYNVRQSKIAIGSGGLFGKGYLNGTSTKNDFVPEQNTDFIFCSIGEQFGFVGSAVLILIYVSLMLRIVALAERQRSDFSRVYGYCVASILFFHFAINISMTIGLAPVIGITLPLLSYGGSSLLSFSILIFILLRLDADRVMAIR